MADDRAGQGPRSDRASSPAELAALDDRELVPRAAAGDGPAFDQLASRYADKVYRLAYKVLRDEQEAEDALQDAFLSAFRNLPRFQGKSSFSTWLYRIAMNAALMRLRKRRDGMVSLEQPSRREDSQATLQIPDWTHSPVGDLMNSELREALYAAVDELPEELQTVFIMREEENLSNAEVAERLGLSVPAVKSRLHRARVELRDRLERHFSERFGARDGKRG